MTHLQYRRLLSLHLYGELTPDQERSLQLHLESCPECRTELGKLKAMHALLDTAQSSKPEENLLAEVRQELRSSLRKARAKRTMWESLQSVFTFGPSPRFSYALGIIAAFALGGFLGYQVFVPEANRM
ncbi:MAG: zf-HC2 domain-containing protein, partial [Bacteroidetes bacterium]|nr:zf-HC2 domain-containing protein [Bacteroidota bacterium]